jgi:hypothetical protein
MGAEQSKSAKFELPDDKPWIWDPWPKPPKQTRIVRVPPVKKRFVKAPPDDDPNEWIKKWLPKPDPDFNPDDHILWQDPVAAMLKKNRENRGVPDPIGRPPKQWENQMDKAWGTYGKHGLGKVGQ